MTTITFTGDNAGLVAKGLKTQTRRIIRPQIEVITYPNPCIYKNDATGKWETTENVCYNWKGIQNHRMVFAEKRSPYKIGDKLAVREPWKIVSWTCEEDEFIIQYKDGVKSDFIYPDEISEDASMRYSQQCTDDCLKAGLKSDRGIFWLGNKEVPTRWRSPRFMPKWASRMQIEVTNVKVERLQDISEEDARAEGMILKETFCMVKPYTAKDMYSAIWESIHGKSSWDLNPFVWAITFKVVQ